MIYLEIAEGFRSSFEARLIEGAAKATLHHQATSVETDLTIVITSDEQMRQLNRQSITGGAWCLAFVGLRSC
jgi:hypothetical protein